MQSPPSFWPIRKAIYIGHFMITLPCATLFSAPILISIHEYSKGHAPWWIFILAVVSGLSVSWLFWGYMVTHWRILAYSKVKNVKELKRHAIKGFLIWPDNHWLVLAEFRTPSQRKQLRQIDRKLFAKHELALKATPQKAEHAIQHSNIHVHYKTSFNFIELVFTLIILFAGIVFMYIGEAFLAFIFILIGVLGSIYEMRQFYDRSAQIEINNKGIYTPASGFVPWSHIQSAEIKKIQRGKRENDYMVFTHTEATNPKITHTDSIELTELDINKEEVATILKIQLG